MMNKENSRYIFLYAAALALAAALLLALAATLLKPFQQKNAETEKKQNILSAVRKADGADDAPNKAQYVDAQYARYITSAYVVNTLGERTEGNAFAVNLEVELHKDPANRLLPVFICTDGDSTRYILPMRGQGLWGPIWGYVALNADFSTIYGAVFDHKGETPGLGAEIASAAFQKQFVGKQIFDLKTSDFTSISVVKGGGAQGNPHAVDAISGGTITSKALEAMMHDFFGQYLNFFKAERRRQISAQRAAERERQRFVADSIAAAEARQKDEARAKWLKWKAEQAARAAADSVARAAQPQPPLPAAIAPRGEVKVEAGEQ